MPIVEQSVGELISVAEIADREGLSRDAVRKWARERSLKATLIGGRLYVDPADLKQFLVRRQIVGRPK